MKIGTLYVCHVVANCRTNSDRVDQYCGDDLVSCFLETALDRDEDLVDDLVEDDVDFDRSTGLLISLRIFASKIAGACVTEILIVSPGDNVPTLGEKIKPHSISGSIEKLVGPTGKMSPLGPIRGTGCLN